MKVLHNKYLEENEANDRKEISAMFDDGTLRWFLVDLCPLKLNCSDEEKSRLNRLSMLLYPSSLFPIRTISLEAKPEIVDHNTRASYLISKLTAQNLKARNRMIARTLDPKYPLSISEEEYWKTPDRISCQPVQAIFLAVLSAQRP